MDVAATLDEGEVLVSWVQIEFWISQHRFETVIHL
jgi:hypothetical protein